MRFLFSVRPYFGHFHPMAPFAAKLVAEGHDVVFATAAPFDEQVRRAGFNAVRAGHDPAAPLPPNVDDAERVDYGVWVTRRKTDDLLELAREWHPHVVVREPTDFPSVLAADLLQVPHATIGFAQFYPVALWSQRLGSTLDVLRHEYHLPPDPYLDRLYPHLYLSTVPPWFERRGATLAPTVVPVRPSTFDLADRLTPPEWLHDLSGRPVVYATLGTVYNKHRRFFSVVADALADDDVHVICTVGRDQDPADVVPSPPANVHVCRYVPQSWLYPRCSAVISHAGFSTVLGALGAGLPMVNVPHGADQPGNATRAAELGAALVIALDQLQPHAMRAAVRHVLHDARFTIAAHALRDAIEQLPPVDHGVRLLIDLPELVAADTDIASYSAVLLGDVGRR